MNYILFGILGIVAAAAFIIYGQKINREKSVLATGLVIAAIIYIFFAFIWGDAYWIGIETLGVLAYSTFYFLGKRFDFRWVGVGWLLHPIWDMRCVNKSGHKTILILCPYEREKTTKSAS